MARWRMQKPSFKADVDSLLDNPTPANADGGADLLETYSVLQAIVENVGMDAISQRVAYPLEGIKVVTYYGCLLSRPAHVAKFDDPNNPVSLDNILKALGAEVIPFALKTECCGAAMGIPNVDVPGSLSGRILETAKALGADAVVTACPLCHMNLDLRQRQAARITKNKPFELPVFYFTQLLALAFGLPEESMRFDKLAVNPKPLLDTIAERREARVVAAMNDARKAAGVAS
jgi:heterodisulfide reductase subunit B